MNIPQEIEREFRKEFAEILPNLIWQTEEGHYEVFGKYRIVPRSLTFEVFCRHDRVGTFNSTKTALSWCIADKLQKYNLARELLHVDNKLALLDNDIKIRAALGDRGRDKDFREAVFAKLETKIIQKKQLKNQLTKCVNVAKYYQQRGFNNETQRTSRSATSRSNRQGF
jgi:hypothetical protein